MQLLFRSHGANVFRVSVSGISNSMGVDTRWSSREDLLSDRGLGSPLGSGNNASSFGHHLPPQQQHHHHGLDAGTSFENSLFVALYDFHAMSDDQLSLSKGE